MVEDKIRQTPPSDDIDLILLLEQFYLYIKRFRNIFIISIIVGILLGGSVYFVSPRIYQSKLILHSAYLTNQEELEIIDYWNQLLQRNGRMILVPILHCREPLLDKIISLEGEQIQKNSSSTDPNGFYINAKITDNSILPELQTAIIYGLNNKEYVKEKIAERKHELQELIDKATLGIRRLDSLKNNMETSIRKNPESILFNIEGINQDLFDLNEKLAGYKTSFKSLTSLQVLQGFLPLKTPVSRSLRVSILMGLILCLSVAYLFSLLKYIEERLKKRVKPDA